MPKGMFVDTTICTGCKACQVACKEWNGLVAEPSHFESRPGVPYPVASHFTGDSYDNTGQMSAADWRRVRFIEQFNEPRTNSRWLFISDSCKHCADAACLNVCPFDAIERTDLGNVVVNQRKCQGTRHCNTACPYAAIHYTERTGTSWKCTLCNDRIHNGLGTACAKACPTGSIMFGELSDLMARANERLAHLKAAGVPGVAIYGYGEAGGLKVFYLLRDAPAVYGLPEKPVVAPRKAELRLRPGPRFAALMVGFGALMRIREKGFSGGSGGTRGQ
jgi:formate dehydrogenase iron-sulfur subunit